MSSPSGGAAFYAAVGTSRRRSASGHDDLGAGAEPQQRSTFPGRPLVRADQSRIQEYGSASPAPAMICTAAGRGTRN
ncbi:MAG: hypothetical protein ACK5O2_14550, partial [Microthrixaceae bacterium]